MSTKWVSIEFGDASIGLGDNTTSSTFCQESFLKLKRLLSSSDGRLDGALLAEFKARVKECPGVLGVFEESSSLPTILHEAAAGHAHDLRLVKWLIQLGALQHQSKLAATDGHRTFTTSNRRLDELAIHSAARCGFSDIVSVLLEANHFRDIDVLTYNTKDSIAHMAVKYGHKSLLEMLLSFGANPCLVNAAGQHLHELTTDTHWSEELLKIENEHKEMLRDRKPTVPLKDNEKGKLLTETNRNRLMNSMAEQKEKEMERSAFTRGPKPLKTRAEKKEMREGDIIPFSSSPLLHQTPNQAGLANIDLLNEKDPGARADEIIQFMDMGFQVLYLEQFDDSPDLRSNTAMTVLHLVRGFVRIAEYFGESHTHLFEVAHVRNHFAQILVRVIYTFNRHYRYLFMSRGFPPEYYDELSRIVGTTVEWITFVRHVSNNLVTCKHQGQAKEILELVERRLLKLNPRPPIYREMVHAYMSAREDALLEPKEGSTPNAMKAFEWYLTDLSIDFELLQDLDRLHGCNFFKTMTFVAPLPPSALSEISQKLSSNGEIRVVMMKNSLLLGAGSLAKLRTALKTALSIAQVLDVSLVSDPSPP